MAHRKKSFLSFSFFTREKKTSESAKTEKSKSFWHLNNEAMLVYFLCKKSSVHKPLLWNTCHSPFYWTLLTPHYLASRSFHYQFLHHLQYWKWTEGRWKGKHIHKYTTHSPDGQPDNIGDFRSDRWNSNLSLLEMKPAPMTLSNRSIQKDSSLWKVKKPGATFNFTTSSFCRLLKYVFCGVKPHLFSFIKQVTTSYKSFFIFFPILNNIPRLPLCLASLS